MSIFVYWKICNYLERLDLFARSPNRGAHLPLILKIASCTSKAEIRELLAMPIQEKFSDRFLEVNLI